MSGAWRSRHGSSLCQGTPHTHCGSWTYFFSSAHLPVLALRYTSHMGVFCQAMMPMRCQDAAMMESIKRIRLKFIKICVAQGSSRECTGKSPCHTSLSLVWIAFKGVCCCGAAVCVYIYFYMCIYQLFRQHGKRNNVAGCIYTLFCIFCKVRTLGGFFFVFFSFSSPECS